MAPEQLTALAAVLGALASLGTLVFAVVIWVQGLRAKARSIDAAVLQNTIHKRVNSLSDTRAAEAEAAGFTKGRAQRTDDRLEALENGKPPPKPEPS